MVLGKGAVHFGELTRRYIGEGKLVEAKGYVRKFVCAHTFQLECQTAADNDVLVFLVETESLSRGKFYDLLLGRKGQVREPFLHLQLLKCLQHKRINVPKQHSLGWGALKPVSVLPGSETRFKWRDFIWEVEVPQWESETGKERSQRPCWPMWGSTCLRVTPRKR